MADEHELRQIAGSLSTIERHLSLLVSHLVPEEVRLALLAGERTPKHVAGQLRSGWGVPADQVPEKRVDAEALLAQLRTGQA